MKIVLHSLERDPDGRHVVLRLQIGEEETITYRALPEMEGNAMRVGSSDGSFEEMTARLSEMAKKEDKRGSTYIGHLLALILRDQRSEPLSLPAVMDGSIFTPHEPNPWKRAWSRFLRKF